LTHFTNLLEQQLLGSESSVLITRDRLTGNDIVSVNVRDPKNQSLLDIIQERDYTFDKRGIKRRTEEKDTFTSNSTKSESTCPPFLTLQTNKQKIHKNLISQYSLCSRSKTIQNRTTVHYEERSQNKRREIV
jgi:hypothetical protein